MKRNKLLLVFAVCILSSIANAQITIDSISTSLFNGIDTFMQVKNLSNYTTLYDKKLNGTWDLRNVNYDSQLILHKRRVNTSTNFPNASFQQFKNYEFTKGNFITYVEAINTSGNLNYVEGEEILDSQIVSLTSITNGAKDEIVFPPQKILHLNPDINPIYPIQLNTLMWYSAQKSVKFNLSIIDSGIVNAACQMNTYFDYIDTVVGWGKLKCKNAFTGNFHEIDVLQVNRFESRSDTYLLNGSGAPSKFYSALGIKKDEQIVYSSTRFYRLNEIEPIVTIYFNHRNRTDPINIIIHQDRLGNPIAGIGDSGFEKTLFVYPNPAKDFLHVELPNTSANWSYSILDLNGKIILSQDLQKLDGFGIDIPVAQLSEGLFILTLSNGNNVYNRKITIIK